MNGEAARAPFSTRSVLVLVLFGSVVFVALLWMIGAGMTSGSTNDGGSHAGGKGLNGYAAMAGYLERRGYAVRLSRNEGALEAPGLLVLTPLQWTDGEKLAEIANKRRYTGPTLIITPKWVAAPVPPATPKAKKGWVQLAGIEPPTWKGFLDDVTVTVAPLAKGEKTGWKGLGLAGKLPQPGHVLSGSGPRIASLVVDAGGQRVLAGYVEDGGSYPALEEAAIDRHGSRELESGPYPLVLVFEPDLLDNYGMADPTNARLAERLVRTIAGPDDKRIVFDLTLNGYARSANLLTLAFTPPFLAATLCLLMAALVVGWRAFLRFGPPAKPARVIAFGKRQLVANAAGLIRRTRRYHLISAPYLARARQRIVRALGLPREAGAAQADAVIDRALAARRPDARPFSALAARLAAARRPHDILKAARDLHALERTLTR